jgi:hypothetical protein
MQHKALSKIWTLDLKYEHNILILKYMNTRDRLPAEQESCGSVWIFEFAQWAKVHLLQIYNDMQTWNCSLYHSFHNIFISLWSLYWTSDFALKIVYYCAFLPASTHTRKFMHADKLLKVTHLPAHYKAQVYRQAWREGVCVCVCKQHLCYELWWWWWWCKRY